MTSTPLNLFEHTKQEGVLNSEESTFKRSWWNFLVGKASTDSLGFEGEFTFKYKTPSYIEFNIGRILWIVSIYYFIYHTFFLGEKQLAFNELSTGNPFSKPEKNEYVPSYESLYYFDRPNLK